MNLKKRRTHDGIVGLLVLAGIVLGYYIDTIWLLVPAIVGALLIQSAFTSFCPVYFVLDKVMEKET